MSHTTPDPTDLRRALTTDELRARLASANEEVRRATVVALDGPTDGNDAAAGREALALLVEALGDVSWRVRKEAVARAASWRWPEPAANALAAALSEPDNVGRRNATIEALARLGPVALLPLVTALDEKPPHRKLIAEALGLLGDARAVGPIGRLLDDEDENVRVAAAEALGRIGDAAALGELRRALDRGEILLSLACLDGLNRLEARIEADRLEPLLASPALRPAVMEALGLSRDGRAVPHLVRSLTDGARGVRMAALGALHQLHEALDADGRRELETTLGRLPEATERVLVEALRDATPDARRAAARLLGLTRRVGTAAIRALAEALGDDEVEEVAAQALVTVAAAAVAPLGELVALVEPAARAGIYRVLARIGSPSPTPLQMALLREGLRDDDPAAAEAAAWALGELASSDGVAPLVAALDGDEGVAEAATLGLCRLGSSFPEEVRAAVTPGLASPESPIARYLCRALGVCGHDADLPLLHRALHAASSSTRRAAADALGRLGGDAETEDALCYLLADEVSEVRAAAVRALGQVGAAESQRPGAARATPSELPRPLVEALEGACSDGDAAVRADAVRALGRLGGEDAQTALRSLAASTDSVVAVPAIEALGRAGDPRDTALLLGALDRGDHEILKASLGALVPLATPEAVFGLGRALDHARWDVRLAAAEALARRGEDASLALLAVRLAVEPHGAVRQALEAALARARR